MNESGQSTVSTYWANIYVGLRPGYDGEPQPIQTATDAVQAYVDAKGLCVTVTETRFVYTNGSEAGIIVGLINYPRFPATPESIREHALALGELLRHHLMQTRVSVMFPDKTVMLGER